MSLSKKAHWQHLKWKCSLFFLSLRHFTTASCFLCLCGLTFDCDQLLITVSNSVVVVPSSTFPCGFPGAEDTFWFKLQTVCLFFYLEMSLNLNHYDLKFENYLLWILFITPYFVWSILEYLLSTVPWCLKQLLELLVCCCSVNASQIWRSGHPHRVESTSLLSNEFCFARSKSYLCWYRPKTKFLWCLFECDSFFSTCLGKIFFFLVLLPSLFWPHSRWTS